MTELIRVAIFDTTREPDTKFAGLGWGLMGLGRTRIGPFNKRVIWVNPYNMYNPYKPD